MAIKSGHEGERVNTGYKMIDMNRLGILTGIFVCGGIVKSTVSTYISQA